MNFHQMFIILFLIKCSIKFQLWDENFRIYNLFQRKILHKHIDQGVNFRKLAKKNIKIQKLGKWLLAHFGCILAQKFASRMRAPVYCWQSLRIENKDNVNKRDYSLRNIWRRKVINSCCSKDPEGRKSSTFWKRHCRAKIALGSRHLTQN